MPRRGTVRWFSRARGYGFIRDDEGGDVFVHFSEIQQDGYKALKAGARVQFELANGRGGLQANLVRLDDYDDTPKSARSIG
jgi:CspA family cold shock protein